MTQPSASIPTTPVMPRRRNTEASPWDAGRRHTPARDRDALEPMLDELADLIEILQRGPRDHEHKPPRHVGLSAPQLVDYARVAVRQAHFDGFGNHTPGMDAPEAKPRNVLDKNGDAIVPDPDPGPPISDPTGEAVARSVETTPAAVRSAQRIAGDVAQALDVIRDAVNVLVRSQPDDDATTHKAAGDPCCKSHARYDIYEPIHDQARVHELCRWCYDFWRQWSQWPPKPLIERRANGLVIRNKDLRDAGIAS